jgi:P4 family phage/plasmid primase-like protien
MDSLTDEQTKLFKEFVSQLGFSNVKSHLTELKERGEIIQDLGRTIYQFFDKRDLARQMLQHQPIYYDKAKNWWIWSWKEYKWIIMDETEVLNSVEYNSRTNTISSKDKLEILEALKQESRKYNPEKPKPTWIQFKEKIIDIETDEVFSAQPKYFVTNPIPYNLGKSEETPNMDRIFKEWVGEKYVKTLYQIISYCLIPNYPLSRIFCFYGAGMNGKSKFLELLRKFIGDYNCCSTELDVLSTSRFELSRLHKKLVCQMGETNFNELRRTSVLKKLTGNDLIGFEYKGSKHFEDINYAKILISTNNLPTTDDKSLGFYRRWLIIDFPNQFNEKKDILSEIPEEEYENLAKKCINILKDLLNVREFSNEGNIEERMNKFESKSDFLQKFIHDFTKEAFGEYITCNDFKKKFADWCGNNKHRGMSDVVLGQEMKKRGFQQERKYMNWLYDGKGGQMRVWMDITWKD